MNYAMILCAGYGTRMHEHTANCPKPMLPICGKPILEHTVNHLEGLGITNIVVNLHYLPDVITSYFGDGSKWGVSIRYSYETKPLGTAGALKAAQGFFGDADNIFVLYGDVISNENYLKLSRFRNEKQALAAIVIHERLSSNSVVEIDAAGKIVRFIERPKHEVQDKAQNWVNSGLYCIGKEVLELIPGGIPSDFPRDVFPGLIACGLLYGYPLTGYRCAIDSPERYLETQHDFEASGGVFPAHGSKPQRGLVRSCTTARRNIMTVHGG